MWPKADKNHKRSAVGSSLQNQNTLNTDPSSRSQKRKAAAPRSSLLSPPKKKKNVKLSLLLQSSKFGSSRGGESPLSIVTTKKSLAGRKKKSPVKSHSSSPCPEASPSRFLSPNHVQVNEKHHLIVSKNDVISHKYKVIDLAGAGTFGRVYSVRDISGSENAPLLALKVMQDEEEAREDATYEREALEKIMEGDPHHLQNIVRFYGHFDYHGHPCLIFEHLGPSLYRFLDSAKASFVPVAMHQLSEIVQNVCFALAYLRKCNLTHTDIKTENIVFAREVTFNDITYLSDSAQTLVRELSITDVKLIDFGSAIGDSDAHGKDITTRQYRAPEIILELEWDQACDIWSVGCVVFEIYAGHVLFQAPTVKDQIAAMLQILGPLPSKMLSKVASDHKYFKNGKFNISDNYHTSSGYLDSVAKAKPLKESLRDPDGTETVKFYDLLKQMLQYDPKKRITATDALYHDFLNQRICRKRKRN